VIAIHRLTSTQTEQTIPVLSALLQDVVNSGASVGFLPPLDAQTAEKYWREVVRAMEQDTRILLVAYDDVRLVGTVQLDLCMRGNGLHRAEVMKLLVHTSVRRQGIGYALMTAIEDKARKAGRTTLVLDTRAGDPSEKLYAKLGYIKAGEIPQYAKSANGALDPSAFYYRLL
jgi:acetyltransferase